MDLLDKASSLYAAGAEECIVAALFGADAEQVYSAISLTGLRPDDLFLLGHSLVLQAFAELSAQGQDPDASTLANYIKTMGAYNPQAQREIENAITASYSLRNIDKYVAVVIDKARARKMHKSLSAINEKLPQIGGVLSADDVLRDLDAISLSLSERNATNGLLRTATDHLHAVVERMESVQNGEKRGLYSGIEELDEHLGGFQDGDLIIIGARPSMGKTALALNIAEHGASPPVAQGAPVDPAESPLGVVMSLEMPETDLMLRVIAKSGGIEFSRLRKSELSNEDWERFTHAMGRYQHTDLRIDDSSHLTPGILRQKLRLLMRQTGKKVSFVIIDYLQLMMDDDRHQNRSAEISAISRKLKVLAKEIGAPIIALSQLNRELEKRADKRPMMSDLRESGALEQDADVILFLYRDEYYNPDSDYKGIAEIIIAKGRNVGVGMVATQFDGRFQRFQSMPKGAHSYDSTYGS